MSKILPVVLSALGLGAGIGGGIALRPDPVETVEMNPCGDVAVPHTASAIPNEKVTDENVDYVKLNNQFVIPVVQDGRVSALVVLALSLEVASGQQELVYQREPKLRDVFLQVLFDHANAGGFDGAFTSGLNMSLLRDALRESAIKTLGSIISDVLIVDVVRQDA
ncbi:MAG: flagellar basal body-associated FliL family protein [Marinosulfonomonas sp.]|nr:flagellar basal body-associated FliL family protein [Marinosulfonomonas sp.]